MTSAVARLTVLLPPMIVMSVPTALSNNLLLGFSLSQGTITSFTLLQAPEITGPWTTNTSPRSPRRRGMAGTWQSQ